MPKFELIVEGISCVKCVGRIETALNKQSPRPAAVKIDFITNKILLSINEQSSIEQYTNVISSLGYHVNKVLEIMSSQEGNNHSRLLRIKVIKGNPQLVLSKLMSPELNGFILDKPVISQQFVSIKYDPFLVRGSSIIDKIRDLEHTENLIFTLDNPFEENEEIKFSSYTGYQVIICMLCLIFLVILSVLPSHLILYPESWGIASIMMILTLIMTIVIMKVVGYSIFKLCIKQFASKNINMITLISIGSGFAFIFGVIFFVIGIIQTSKGNFENMMMYIENASQHLQTSAAIFTSVVAGKYLQGSIKKRVYQRITELKDSMKVHVSSVKRVIPKNKDLDILNSEDVHPALIERDDLISAKEGLLPFDGFVEKGNVKVVENAQFGWEAVETRAVGHRVISGSKIVSIEPNTIIRVTEPIEQTVAGKLFLVIKETTSGNPLDEKTSEFISKFTRWFIASIFLIALVVLVFWLVDYSKDFTGMEISLSYPFEKAVAVLVASCPCALGSAIPMIYAIAIRKALKSGVLVKDSSAIDSLNEIDNIVFDKTGTITGSFNLKETQIYSDKYSEAILWELISLIERDHLQHPIGLAIYQESLKKLSQFNTGGAGKKSSKLLIQKDNKEAHIYHGSEGIIESGIQINGSYPSLAFGNVKLMKRVGITSDDLLVQPHQLSLTSVRVETSNTADLEAKLVSKNYSNNTIDIFLAIDSELAFRVSLDLKENLKENVHNLIENLTKNNKTIHLLTGDSKGNALETARILQIKPEHVKAEVTPYEKEEYIRQLMRSHKKVMMVGDGINDIKAFQEASLSCTINFKSPQNLSFSNFVIIDNDVENITGLFKFGRVTRNFKIIILVVSILYNIPVIFAAGGFFNILFGLDMPAFMAAWTMFLSSVILTLLANVIDLISFKIKRKNLIIAKKSC